MDSEKFVKISAKTLVTVIIHGGNKLGFRTARTLLEQGSKVIIIDDYTSDSKKYIESLKKLGDVDFIDLEGLEGFYEKVDRIDYIIYNLYDDLLRKDRFESKEFLRESNYLDLTLESALKYNSKFSLLSTIKLNVDLALESSDPKYVKPSPYSSVELQKYAETLSAEYHDKSKANARIIRLGYIIGDEDIDLGYNPELREIFKDAVTSSTIKIHGEGLQNHYLLNVKDAVYGILKLTFSDSTNGEVISLCNDNEYTTLSIAYKVLELNPEATEIQFVEGEHDKPLIKEFYIPATNATEYGWKQTVTLERSIMDVLDDIYTQQSRDWENKPDKEAHFQEKLDEIKEKDKVRKGNVIKTPLGKFVDALIKPFRSFFINTRDNIKSWSLWDLMRFLMFTGVGVVIFYFLLGPLLIISISSGLIYYQGKGAYADVQSFQFDPALDKLDRVVAYSENINKNVKRLKWVSDITGKEEVYKSYLNLSNSLELGAKGSRNALEGIKPLGGYIQDFEPAVNFSGSGSSVTNTTREYRVYLNELAANEQLLNKASYDLLLALNILSDVDEEKVFGFMQSQVVKAKELGVEVEGYVDVTKQLLVFLPTLLGSEERKRYLFLLQNPSELRSTGGWISSYGLIGMDGGQVRELEVSDVYTIDGLLKDQGKFYKPPEEMEEALNINTWNLSLSNWSPNFVTTSNNAEFFLKESGKVYDVDGVIAVNLTFVKDLLAKWGELEVSVSDIAGNFEGENTKIVTSSNLYDILFEIHKAYTPGATVKSDFLANLSNAVIEKILSSDVQDYLELLDVVRGSLNKKDILVYIKEQNLNKYITAKSWSGALKEDYKTAPIGVEWNWGANKANYFLNKDTELKMEIVDEDEIEYTYSLNIKNNSDINVYPEGDYENYLRIFIPEDSVLVSTSGFNQDLYEISYSEGFKVVGGWFNVPVESSKNFQIKYSLKRNDNYFPIEYNDQNISYDLVVYKQPGDMNNSLDVSVYYPDRWAVSQDGGMSKGSSAVLSGEWDYSSDVEVDLDWVWK